MQGTITKNKLKSGRVSWGYVFDGGKRSDGKRGQVTKQGFKTKGDAQEALRLAIQEAEQRKPQSEETFGAFFTRWLEEYGPAHWGPKTRQENASRAKYMIGKFGDIPMTELAPEVIERGLQQLKAAGGIQGRPLSGKTVSEAAGLMSQALKTARRWGILAFNPMEDVKRPPKEKRETAPPEISEFERYLASVQGTRYYTLSLFCGTTGARRGEALALTWPDINWQTGEVILCKAVIQIRQGNGTSKILLKSTKGNRSRKLRMTPSTLDALRRHRDEMDRERDLYGTSYDDRTPLVFPRLGGGYQKPDKVSQRIREYMQRAGLDASLHSLRHMHASELLSDGVPLPAVSERLGHWDANVTLGVYSHVMQRDETALLHKVEEKTAALIERTRGEQPKKPKAMLRALPAKLG